MGIAGADGLNAGDVILASLAGQTVQQRSDRGPAYVRHTAARKPSATLAKPMGATTPPQGDVGADQYLLGQRHALAGGRRVRAKK
ncbi:hypothetical protein [Rhizobium sp. BK491]|uniref:hypothetical protein n=1 Tax=Rhizobium sp. BK491 TaxID=2587009 RepID=UPI001613816A|nr:hypothetical protein [Rhizobium sp. BK491]MBB3571598.1 hypothetical protein [Rhizobium sp. BK491]